MEYRSELYGLGGQQLSSARPGRFKRPERAEESCWISLASGFNELNEVRKKKPMNSPQNTRLVPVSHLLEEYLVTFHFAVIQ